VVESNAEEPGLAIAGNLRPSARPPSPPDEANSALVRGGAAHACFPRHGSAIIRKCRKRTHRLFQTNRRPGAPPQEGVVRRCPPHDEGRSPNNRSRAVCSGPNCWRSPGGCYPAPDLPTNPFMTLLPHAQKAREIAKPARFAMRKLAAPRRRPRYAASRSRSSQSRRRPFLG